MTALVVTVREFMEEGSILAMVREGVRNFRLNAARVGREDLTPCADCIRRSAERCGVEIKLFVDLPGPKPRVWFLGRDYCYKMRRNERYRIDVSDLPRDEECFQIVGPEFFSAVRVGSTLHVREAGYVRLLVEDRSSEWLSARALCDGLFGGGYHVYMEGEYVPSQSLSRADYLVLPAVLRTRPDFLCPSFVDDVCAVTALRAELDRAGSGASVLAKIESPVGLSNLASIVAAADGAVVGRDDLSVWTDAASLRRETYRVLRFCKSHGRRAVTASNYFASLCRGTILSDGDRAELKAVLSLDPDYLYCNETSTSHRERDPRLFEAARSLGLM